jgi:hypothetical protein
MLSTQRRAARLAAALAATAAVVAGLAVASDLQASSAANPTASDYCVVVDPIYVANKPIYHGGVYCVPVPDPSQPM